MYLVDEENIYLRAFELESNFVPVLSYASRGKLGPIIEGLRYYIAIQNPCYRPVYLKSGDVVIGIGTTSGDQCKTLDYDTSLGGQRNYFLRQ